MDITIQKSVDLWVAYLKKFYFSEIDAIFDFHQFELNLEDALIDAQQQGKVSMNDLATDDFFARELSRIAANALELNLVLTEDDKKKLIDLLNESLVDYRESLEIKSVMEADLEKKQKLNANPPEIIDPRSEETKGNFSTRKL